MDPEPQWTLVIGPRRHWWGLRLRELWQARDLVVLFVWRDFVSVYKQSLLGPLWFLIQPLMTTLTFTVVFGNIAGISTDGTPTFLFYMTGTTLWSYFSACLIKTSNTFIVNAAIFGKVYFPRLTVPISIIVSNMVTFSIQFLLLVALVVFHALKTGAVRSDLAWASMFPAYVLLMAGFGLGGGIIVSSLTTRYRDLQFVVAFGTQLFMFATPIIYPLSTVPPKWRWLMSINPLTPIMEGFRKGLLGAGTVAAQEMLYSFAFMACVLLAGIMLFNRVEGTFMDTV